MLKCDRQAARACGFKRETPSHGLFTHFRRRLKKAGYDKAFLLLLSRLLKFKVVNGGAVALDSTTIKAYSQRDLENRKRKTMLTPGLEEEEEVLC